MKTNDHINCTDQNCRSNNGGKAKSEFCPSCRGMIALKYAPQHGISIKKAKIIVMVLDPCAPNDLHNELSEMYAIAKRVDLRRFLRRVPLPYINAYFGYKSARSKGLMFQDDKSLVFYESKFLGCSVLIMENEGKHYIFAHPLAFGAANLNKTDEPVKNELVQRYPITTYSSF